MGSARQDPRGSFRAMQHWELALNHYFTTGKQLPEP